MAYKTILPSASYANTAAATSPAVATDGWLGGIFYVNITAITGSIIVKVQRMDKISGNWTDLPSAVTASLSSTGLTELVVFPGVAETANVSVSDVLGPPIRVIGTITTGPCTMSVGVELIGG